MFGLVVRRLVSIVPVVFIVSLMAFSLIHLVPGDAAVTVAGEYATEEQVELTRERLGLNDPLLVQYGKWAGGALTGDFGTSIFSSLPVAEAIISRAPVTLSLTAVALLIALVFGLTTGIVSGLRPHTVLDRLAGVGATIGIAMPSFWLGLVLVTVFALVNPWLPASGYVPLSEGFVPWLRHIIMPAVALGAATTAEVSRQTRSGVIDVMQQDYVRTAHSKGLPLRRIVGRHVLKNAALPVVTVFGTQASRLLGGAIVVEAIFGLPGLGTLVLNAVLQRDYPMVQGFVIFITLIVLLVNLLVDVSYGYFNPKVRQA